ncbi:MAG: hypothetical protein E2O68_07995 [Deltaproteobacteria bacterium]|nr:MAG: hypothetical protein E2O68_07995 [Deltaproteobacteria bacterium]
MGRILILFLLLGNLNSAFGYSYFYFDSKKVNVSNRSFHNYIRPQIRNLVQDFYSVLKKINPLQEDTINLKILTHRFKKKWKDYLPHCKKEECTDNFEDLKSLAKRINKKTLKLEKKISGLFSKRRNIDSTIQLSDYSGKISDIWYNILNHLENPLLLKEKKQVGIYLNQALINTEIILISPLDDEIQKNFYFVWSNFIKKLEQEIIEKQNLKFLVTRLEELNITWNSFYMKVPRWKELISGTPKNQLKIMHRRWNSILKIILVR